MVEFPDYKVTTMDFHLNINIAGAYMVDSFLYVTTKDQSNALDRTERFAFDENLKKCGFNFTIPDDSIDLIQTQSLGLVSMIAYKKDVSNRPLIIPIKEAEFGMCTEIEFN